MQLDHLVTAAQPRSFAEMAAAHKARQARFAAAAKHVVQKPQIVIRRSPSAPPPADRFKPLWMFGHLHFDHHLGAYARHQLEQALIGGHRLKRYIRDRAREMGLTYAVVVGQSRKRPIVAARDLIAWEIKTTVKPEISYPELGRLFGGRDHTSVLHSVRKIEKQRASA